MEHEFELYQQVKKYLEGLGYPSNSIIPEYPGPNNNHIDIVIKTAKDVLVAIEIKNKLFINTTSNEELSYHPVARLLQKNAEELGAKYYMLSDGRQNVWMKTGVNGRPETTIEIKYSNFDATTLSNAEFTKFILAHVFEYIKNYPITGDPLFDSSIILYIRLLQELGNNRDLPFDLNEIIGRTHLTEKKSKSYSVDKVVHEALERLREVNLLENKNSVLEFIDEYFQIYRREWNIPRWLADFMAKLILQKPESILVDMFTRNGVLTSTSYLNNYKNVLSFYSNQDEIYWIKSQQILSSSKEQELKFEPGLLRGELDVVPKQFADGVLVALPFNLKFDFFRTSNLTSLGIKDSNSLYLEAAFDALRHNGKVIAIVPDGFLLSSSYAKTRDYFKNNGFIQAVISLPSDTFSPYSSVKTSLIVLEKKPSSIQSNTFFASLEESPKKNLINSRDNKNINTILSNFEWFNDSNTLQVDPSKNGFLVNNIDGKNFHFTKYWFESSHEDRNILDSNYSAIPLKELIIDIKRGSALVSDPKSGNIPFVSPASIRSLLLKKEELSYTSSSKLPKGAIRRIEENDIIVNIIGPYRGKAALATSEVIGFPINRHLISIKANLSLIIPQYLAIALNSKYVQDQFLDKSSGAVIQALNLASFEEIYLPVPDIEEQEKIYSEYSKLLDELSRIKDRESEIQSKLNNKLNGLGKGGDLL